MEDKPLFGPVDQVVNTLESETSWVKAEIRRCEKAINRNKSDIDILQVRLKNLDESMAYVRRQAKVESKPQAKIEKAPIIKRGMIRRKP